MRSFLRPTSARSGKRKNGPQHAAKPAKAPERRRNSRREVLLFSCFRIGHQQNNPSHCVGLGLISEFRTNQFSVFVVPGQKSPVFFRQSKFSWTSGDTGVPSALFTVTRKASFAMAPDRGSGITGQTTYLGSPGPGCFACGSSNNCTKPAFTNWLIWSSVLNTGVPSRLAPFSAIRAADAC